MSAPRPIIATAWRWSPLFVAGAILVWHSLQYDFVTDDAYISFVYSRNFAEHNSLVFNLGDPVEGYTNFLWTFILGLFLKVGLPPESMSRLLGTGFALATMVVGFRLVEWIHRRPSGWGYLVPALLAGASGYACWASGGLETQLFTFWVALALYAYTRADHESRWWRWVGIALALASMTRPEGVLCAGVFAIHRVAVNLIRDRRAMPTRPELSCVVGFLILWAPWFAWRWWYYGYPFPNTYYVKAAGEVVGDDYHSRVIQNGLYYVWQWLRQTRLLWVTPLALAGLLWARPRTPRFLFGSLAGLVAAVYLVYTIRVGGDFMGLHRFIMPLFFVAAVAVVLGLSSLVELFPSGRPRAIAAVVAALALLGGFGHSQYRLTVESLRWGNFENDHGIDTPAFLAVYTADRAAIGKHMKGCFRPGDFAVFGGVGAQPYYSEVQGIDLFGLVSWDIAHCQPRKNPRAGHNKWAEDQLLARQPRSDGHFCPPRGPSGSFDWSQVDGGPPDFWFARYAIHADPRRPTHWQGSGPVAGYQRVTLHIGCTDAVHTGHPAGWRPAGPELEQSGSFYSFYVHKERMKTFQCPGLVK